MECCGFLWELVKGRSSSNRSGANASPVKTVETNMLSKYAAELNSYTSACKTDLTLKTFDSSLHQRTNSVISALAAQAKAQSLNLDSLMEVYGFLLELNQVALRVIIDSKEDIWKNKDLKSLVDVYFNSTSRTLHFCNTVENCVKKTEISQLIIRFAVTQFEKESVDTDVVASKKKKYAKTLEELNKFKAMGDPFDGEFVTQYESVYEQQVLLLRELHKLKVKLDKKHRNVKTWRILSNVVFATTFVSVFVLSVVAAAVIAPPVVSAVAAGLIVPVEVAGKWCWQDVEGVREGCEETGGLVLSLELGAQVINVAMENIKFEVDNLQIRMSSILYNVEFAVEREEEESATRFAMEEIMKKVEGFTMKIEEVGENAARCSKLIALGRLLILGHILSLPANQFRRNINGVYDDEFLHSTLGSRVCLSSIMGFYVGLLDPILFYYVLYILISTRYNNVLLVFLRVKKVRLQEDLKRFKTKLLDLCKVSIFGLSLSAYHIMRDNV